MSLSDNSPQSLSREKFVARYGALFEHSPWVAEAAWDAGLDEDVATKEGLHRALTRAMYNGNPVQQQMLINAHPDLAGRLALAGGLTEDSAKEQASAGLDRLSPEELRDFTDMNARYKARFGFPFIIAVKGLSKDDILAAFQARILQEPKAEFQTALAEIAKIALLRLKDMPA